MNARKRPKARKALARRSQTAEVIQPPPVDTQALVRAALTQDLHLESFALEEYKPTPAELAIVSEPPPLDQVRVKPNRHGSVYLPHMVYTRWLNRAFGWMGWTLRPASLPRVIDNNVVAPYVLYIHRIPVAFAWGEQEYHPNNRDQSYGDAVEATHASALRRATKHIGMALELWDPDVAEAFKADHCVLVTVTDKEGKESKAWRLKNGRRLWNEVKRGQQDSRPEPEVPREPIRRLLPEAAAVQPIGKAQLDRFWQIAKLNGRAEADVKAWLKGLGYKRPSDIKMSSYDDLVSALEASGDLI